MRSKNASAIILTLVLIVGAIATKPITSSSSPNTRVFVDPPSIIDLTKVAGTQLTIRLNISDVTDLNLWDIWVRFNPLLLYSDESMIVEGPFLKQGGTTLFAAAVHQDYITVGASLTERGAMYSGSGELATITFNVIALGECDLNLFKVALSTLDENDSPIVSIPYQADNGYFRNVESTRIPVSKFVYSALAYNVTFNASISYDPDGTLGEYIWFWSGASNSTETTPIIYHVYPATNPPKEENATVRLIVVDNDGITSNICAKLIRFGVATHDNAVVNMKISPQNILVGQSVNINVTVTNQGNQIESFNVTIYQNVTETDYNNITNTQWEAIQTKEVAGLAGLEERTLSFTVNTSDFSLGRHVVKAEAEAVQNETDTSNNYLLDSFTVAEILYPPVAKFSYSPEMPKVDEPTLFNATQSFDPDGNIANYRWDFGDGTIITEADPIITHIYSIIGNFNVNLTVTDGEGLSNSTSRLIPVRKNPAANYAYAPALPSVNEPLTFNASASTRGSGEIASYSWNFGDGNLSTRSIPIVVHFYTVRGTYNVTLTVFSSDGLDDTTWQLVKVYTKPRAEFSYWPTYPVANEQVVFSASASSDQDSYIASYVWDFGDGNVTSSNAHARILLFSIIHYYRTHGNFTVILTLVDNQGLNNTETKTVAVGELSKPTILPYIGVAIIIIVAVALLLFWFVRKKRRLLQKP